MLRSPIILINFKAYSQAVGKRALKLAQTCQVVAKKYKVNIAVSPQHADIYPIANKIKIPVFAQHIDPIEPGAHTGSIAPQSVRAAGAVGTLINHSEKRIPIEEIAKCLEFAKKEKLATVCCAEGIVESREIARLDPDFIAYEPPELIGSGVSVSDARPEIVERVVKIVNRVNPRVKVLCGAGITNGNDVKKAIELGTYGVLVASGVVKAENPKKVLIDFAEALKS